MNLGKQRISAVCLAVFLSLGIIFFTGLIPEWGRWYSNHLPHRWQVERLLHGHLGLTSDPSGMSWDLAWGKGAVQQVWGIGIPFWQLPFEVLARAVGQPAFPDRITFFIALLGVVYVVVRFHFRLGSEIVPELNSAFTALGVSTLFLFPPFLALCSSRFLVYEEVVAYAYLMGLLLMTWTARLWLRPSLRSFYGLAFVSGLAMFIRPTFGTYGFASLILGCIAIWKNGHSIRLCITGVALFFFAVGSLLWSNNLRFGSCLEFGYSLNVNGMNAMVYAQRFGSPYHQIALIPAAKELFGLLFLSKSLTMQDAYGLGEYPLQSPTFRWRELYFSTYDLSIFFIVIAVIGWLLWRLLWRARAGQLFEKPNALEVVSVWSAIAILPLTGFYLRFPFISSRYLLDFGPAFAATSWVFFALLSKLCRFAKSGTPWMKALLLLLVLGWLGYEIMSIKVPEASWPITQTELIDRMEIDVTNTIRRVQIPLSYTNGFAFEDSGIAFNGIGWDARTGTTKACVLVYVESPQCLVLDVTTTNQTIVSTNEFDCIQAKIGLEWLQHKNVVITPSGVKLTFDGPKARRYQTGIQQAVVAFVAPDELNNNDSKFQLLRVGWRRESTAATLLAR